MKRFARPAELPKPPLPEQRPSADTRHGRERQDSYAWLRAANWQDVFKDTGLLDPSIRAHLEAENNYQKAVMSGTEALREALVKEMRGRIKEDDSSVPAPDGPFAYGIAFETGAEHPRFIRVPREGGPEQVMLDAQIEAADRPYFSLGGASHSDDHRWLAYAYDDKGSEFYSLQLRDLETGKDSETVIEDTSGGGVFSADGKYLFYVRLDANHRPSKLFRHEIGSDPATDALIYEEDDAGFFMGVGKTQSGDTILIEGLNAAEQADFEQYLTQVGDDVQIYGLGYDVLIEDTSIEEITDNFTFG